MSGSKLAYGMMMSVGFSLLLWTNVGAVQAASGNVPVKTKLTLSGNLGGFTVSTPDGRYIQELSKDFKHSWLVTMDGRRYPLPDSETRIYDSTPNGDVVMWGPAGAGMISYVFRPGVGIVRKFPDAGDKFAAVSHAAFESGKGHWLTVNSNVSGGDPLLESWTNVDGQFVPLLNNVWQLAWSPNGIDIAAVEGSGYSSESNWLVIYHTKTRQRDVVPINPFDLPLAQMPLRGQLNWSADERYLAVMTTKGIVVYDVKTHNHFSIPAESNSTWGFTASDQLWVISGEAPISMYGGTKFTQVISQNSAWNISSTRMLSDGRLLVEHDDGQISLISCQANRLVTKDVVKNAGTWWYDTQNGYLYYQVASGAVWRIQLPRVR